MAEAGRVVSLWRYPVKSMAGERIASAQIGSYGLHADRTWAVRDVQHDMMTGAKKLPGLLWCTARYARTPPAEAGPGCAPEVIIGLPDGREFSSSDPAVHRALSEHVDHEVELCALPSISEHRLGSYVDAYPVHILTIQSLDAMTALVPGSDFDVRRFRPTIVVDSPAVSVHPEWDWCGGVLHGPHADLAPLIPTIRCVMPSHEQPELKQDREITRAIAAHSRRCLGVYSNVVRPGVIVEGDVLQLESPSHPASESGAVIPNRGGN